MNPFDPRITPVRPDLAAAHLRGHVHAERFVEGQEAELIAAVTPVRQSPVPDAEMVTEALLGERVTIYDVDAEGWAWGQLADDAYVGWLPASALAPPGPAPTHRVSVPRTFLFPAADIKLPPVAAPTLGARLVVTAQEGRFAVTANRRFIPARHVVPIAARTDRDFVTVAERMLGVPYLWGGRTAFGIDCSGLVQTALTAVGLSAPRDSDMQEMALGKPVEFRASFDHLQRGDLVFWKGHVAIVSDPKTLVHANAWHMMVALEPVNDAIRRIAASGLQVTSDLAP